MSELEAKTPEKQPWKILMAAGEVSGDLQGAFLASALMRQAPALEIIGTGGPRMRAAGVDLRIEMAHFSSFGLLEPLRYLRPLQAIFRDVRKLIQSERPALAILIDNGGFNYPLARYLRRLKIPVIYYFPPQLWSAAFLFAGPIARVSGLIISAFEREAEIYRQHGGRVVYLGHPMVDLVKPKPESAASLAGFGAAGGKTLIALMPGSRNQEVNQLADPILGAARIILNRHPGTHFVLPLASPHLRPMLEKKLEQTCLIQHVRIISADVYACLSQCSVILTASGTSTLEAALLEVPMVVAYRLDPLTYWLARRLRITPYAAMPNILLQEEAVPEFLQGDVTPELLAAAVLRFLDDPQLSSSVRLRLRQVRRSLGTEGAIERIASRILQEAALRGAAPF